MTFLQTNVNPFSRLFCIGAKSRIRKKSNFYLFTKSKEIFFKLNINKYSSCFRNLKKFGQFFKFPLFYLTSGMFTTNATLERTATVMLNSGMHTCFRIKERMIAKKFFINLSKSFLYRKDYELH